MESSELATETIERHTHIQEQPENRHARRMGLLIGMLAAALAITEMGEKSAQNEYIAKQIAVTDTWNFYHAKAIKADIADTQAKTLAVLAAINQDKAVGDAAAAAKARAEKEASDSNGGEGKVQLRARAMRETEARDHQLHRYHLLELAVGALQIAIVLASVSVITEIVGFGFAALGLGVLGFLGGLPMMFTP